MTLSYPPYRFAGTQMHEKSNRDEPGYLSATALHGPAYLLAGIRWTRGRRKGIQAE